MKKDDRFRQINGRSGRFLEIDQWDPTTAWVIFDDEPYDEKRVTYSLLEEEK